MTSSDDPALDLYIEVYLQGLPGSTIAEVSASVEAVAERLRAAIIEAQP